MRFQKGRVKGKKKPNKILCMQKWAKVREDDIQIPMVEFC